MRTLLVAAPLCSGLVDIVGDEAHHGRSVLRLGEGDVVRLADGAGAVAEGVVRRVGRHAIAIEVGPVDQPPSGPAQHLTVAVAAPKGDRFADLVRGLTELGVGAILPLICERGERIPGLDRARRVAVEALKQCRRPVLPRIGPVADFSTLKALPGRRIVLDPAGGPAQPGDPSPTVLIIGPEGGFTYDERQALLADGAVAVRLATPVLRIETAALAAAAVWSAAWEGVHP